MSKCHLPPMNERKPKRIKVRIATRPYTRPQILTYHIYGPRPRRGDKVRICDGYYKGRVVTVHRRHSFWRGYTYKAKLVKPIKYSGCSE